MTKRLQYQFIFVIVYDLNEYVKEKSYGLACVKADFRGWVKPLDLRNTSRHLHGPMGHHVRAFRKEGEPPPGISSFTKIRLGWVSPGQFLLVNPGETAMAFLSPLSKGGNMLVVKIPLKTNQYYLIENR